MPMKMDRNRDFKYVDTAEKASIQAALFHFFGLPAKIFTSAGGGQFRD